MKSLTLVALLGIFSLSIPQESIAGAYGLVRAIQSNNIFECPNGTSWEMTQGYSNINYSSGGFRMGCFTAINKAQWILESSFSCEKNFCRVAERIPFMEAPYDSNSGMYTREFLTTVVGTECTLNITDSRGIGGGQWSCQKLTSYKNLVVKTIGKTQGVYYGMYFNDNGSLPLVQYRIVPSNREQTRIFKNSLSCSGSKRFCTRNN